MIFNPWRPYPLWIPKRGGWYQCTIQDFDTNEKRVMDLYFDASTEHWEDRRRLQVFKGYKVYRSGREPLEYNRVTTDALCIRLDVIAWKKNLKPCWWKRKEK